VSEVVAVDIGGTHARFAIANIENGRVLRLDNEITLKTAAHASLQTAWEDFGSQLGRPLPRAASIAVAGPVQGEVLKLTNNPWVIRPAFIPSKLGAERYTLVNDFGAVAHAVAQLGDSRFAHLCGPERPLPTEGVISIIGPGTGLGVAQLLRRRGHYHVIETEGGHIDFAPLDTLEDQIPPISGSITGGCRWSASPPARASPTSTKRWQRSRTDRSGSATRRSSGRPRWRARTASQPQPSIASASRSAPPRATSRSRRARRRW
jgi:glucokinase